MMKNSTGSPVIFRITPSRAISELSINALIDGQKYALRNWIKS